MTVLHFEGVIRNVHYAPQVRSRSLKSSLASDFDINQAPSQGIVKWDDDAILGYAKWVSPKRTRSYPFARLYQVYHLPKKVAIIPVIKDEGAGGDLDRINFITFSWMNLTNIYIILAWYEHFQPHATRADKITGQRFDANYIHNQLQAIRDYQQSALHWNTMHFERDFAHIFQRAIARYQDAEATMGIPMHASSTHEVVLENYLDEEGYFSVDQFRQVSLPRSLSAAQRESQTDHALEILQDGVKAIFSLRNMLGGEYHLTADEVFFQNGQAIIQESKNATHDAFPKMADIHDGLFKLLLFANLDSLRLNGKNFDFAVRLNLTGTVNQSLSLPTTVNAIEAYTQTQNLKASQRQLLILLNLEAEHNPKMQITIRPNE